MPTLHWNTRNADIRAAARAPFHTLSAVTKLGHGDAKAQNPRKQRYRNAAYCNI